MEEYYTDSRRYSGSYFRGRISESDSDEAEITLVFLVGAFCYMIRRGLFEPEELRGMTVTKVSDGTVELDTGDATRRERQLLYESRLIIDVGLASFAEFVFLQLFVFTFDERRMTLFWNQKILERVLYLAFGIDPDMAKRVDTMKRDYDSADSQVRNRQFEATRARRRVNELRLQFQSSSATEQNYEALAKEQERLIHAHEAELSAQEAVKKQVRDANLRLATLIARDSALREEYAQFFQRGMERRPPLAQHPLLAQALSENCCGLCGATGDAVVRTLGSKLNAQQCPLCESPLSSVPSHQEDIHRLQQLDREIAETKKGVNNVLKEIERLRGEESETDSGVQATKEKLAAFDEANEATMLSLRHALSQGGGVDALLTSYRAQLENLLREKRTAEDRRSELKRQLTKRQRDLQRQYLAVEEQFVPVFTSLAYHFLGMPMEIKMETSELAGVNLVIEVRGSVRRQPHHLSESQRFFLDIALRMALTQFISYRSTGGTLFIDTPEGSLDIAYEKRAGEMLSQFVDKGNSIVMTANLNSSKLLQALARSCGRARMQVCRMTDWAELSEVQQEEEQLFEDAYNDIETAFTVT
jgi:hypothetical protein